MRARWQTHLESTLLRPVLLIDEAQEMHPAVLSELRLLAKSAPVRWTTPSGLARDHHLNNLLLRTALIGLAAFHRLLKAAGAK